MMSIAFLNAIAHCILIGTFPASYPPPTVIRAKKYSINHEGSAFYSTLTIHENNTTHYFPYINDPGKNVLMQCIWSSDVLLTTFDKAFLLSKMRKWYIQKSANELTVACHFKHDSEDDYDAWKASTFILEHEYF